MSSGRSETPLLLHLCTGLQSTTASVSAALESAGRRVRALADVYSAMAAIATTPPGSSHVLVACVDGLSDSDMELFELVHAHDPSVRVYVYGDARSRARIERALRAGASEIAELELVAAPVRSNPMLAPDARREVSLVEATSHTQGQGEMSRPSAAPSDAPSARAVFPPGSVGKQPSTAPSAPQVPTPWKSNPSAPKRTPPSRQSPSPEYPAGDKHRSSDRPKVPRPTSQDDALLTAEQFAAILSGFHRAKPTSPSPES